MKKTNSFKFLHCTLAVFLTVLLLASAGITVYGEENTQENSSPVYEENISAPDFTYSIDNGTAVITGYSKTESRIVIPSEIDGLPVTAIGKDAFYNNSDITEVVISEGIATIKSGAFFGCENLRNIDIAGSVRTIENNAFSDCVSLEEITIPEGVTKIEPWTFSGCTNLLTINVPASLSEVNCEFDDTAFFRNEDNWENGMLYLGNHLVAVKKDIEHPVLKEGTKSISNAVFAECTNLSEIEVPKSIEAIAVCTFDGCINLESVTIPNGIEIIDSSAFQRCESLENVYIPESVSSIGENAFLGCTNLSMIYIPESVTYINGSAFMHCPNLVIYGTSGSYAEQYAEENNIKFMAENAENIIIGDYNNDGVLNIEDATLLQHKLVMFDVSDIIASASYDFNGDGEFNVADVTTLQLLIV